MFNHSKCGSHNFNAALEDAPAGAVPGKHCRGHGGTAQTHLLSGGYFHSRTLVNYKVGMQSLHHKITKKLKKILLMLLQICEVHLQQHHFATF